MIFEIFDRYFLFFAEQRQWDKLWMHLNNLLHNPYCMTGLGLIALTLILGFFMRKTDSAKKIVLFRVNVCLYIVGLFLLYLFRQHIEGGGIREMGIEYYLIPKGYHESRVLTTIAHVMIFTPFGYWLTRAFKRRWLLRPMILIVVSLSIEILQLIFARGSLSVQDMIAYVAGGLLGAIPAGIVNIVEDRKAKRRAS